MDTQTSILITIVAGVISLGMYRKSQVKKTMLHESLAGGGGHMEDLDDNKLLLSNNMITKEIGKDTKNNMGASRIQMAHVLHSLEGNLSEGDRIIQVYDYSAVPFAEGIQYTVDLMIFNSATTQSKTKRVICSTNGTITSEFDISPVTGDVVKYKISDDVLSDVIKSDSEDSITGAKFVRDKYAFIDKSTDYDLPPEPEQPLTNNPTDLKVYRQAKALYEKQVKELRNNNEFTRPKIAFVPTSNQPVNVDSIFPHEMPKSYGFGAVEETPVDYNQLSNIKPLKDENFFNSIAQEKSAFSLQYN